MTAQSGIYEIFNTVNGKRYIGSSKNMGARWRDHRRVLRKSKHINPHLQAAWNKYGEDVFKFLPVLTCAPAKEMLLFYEQQLLDKGKPEYNIAVKADSPMRGRTASEETKNKMSKAHTGKKGFKHSDESRKNMSEAHIGNTSRLGTTTSDQGRLNISKAKMGKTRSRESVEKQAAALRGVPKSVGHGANTSAGKRAANDLKRPPNARTLRRRAEFDAARVCNG